MDERQTPDVEKPRRGRAAFLVVGTLSALALVAALYVVARSLRRVETGPVPAALRTAPPDTGFVRARAAFRGKAHTLTARCRMTRKRLQGKLTPVQDSLGQECDSAIAGLLAHVAALDSAKRENRKAAVDSLKVEYARAKAMVKIFTRSGLRSDEVSDDSLDKELKKLISE